MPWPELNEGVVYTDTVKHPPTSPVPTLLEYYASRYEESASRKGWLQRIQNGQIRVDGNVTTDADYSLRDGAALVYHRLPWREPDVPYRLGVLYEDDHLLAVNKPSGLQVLPGGLFQQRTVLKQLEWHTAEKEKHLQVCSSAVAFSDEARRWKPAPVHRLGRGTSGLLLCAKSPAAKSRLAADLAAGTSVSIGRVKKGDREVDRRISKTYRALASGIIMEDEVLAEFPIGKVKYEGVAGGLYMASEKGANFHRETTSNTNTPRSIGSPLSWRSTLCVWRKATRRLEQCRGRKFGGKTFGSCGGWWLPKTGICAARRLWLSVACVAPYVCSSIYKPGDDCCGTCTTRASDSC